jgi:hypothetical protein
MASMDSVLPANLALEAYRFVCSTLNSLPSATAPGSAPPACALLGRRLTIPIDRLLKFGSVVSVQPPAGTTDGKRVLGIYLGQDDVAATSFRVLLHTGVIVKRDLRMVSLVTVRNPWWKRKQTIAPSRGPPGSNIFYEVTGGSKPNPLPVPVAPLHELPTPDLEITPAPDATPVLPVAKIEIVEPVAEPTPATAPPTLTVNTSHGPAVRRSTRTSKRHYEFGMVNDDGTAFSTVHSPLDTGPPNGSRQLTIKEAFQSYPDAAADALAKELAKMNKYKVLEVANKEDKRNITKMFDDAKAGIPPGPNSPVLVQSKVFLKGKYRADGTFDRVTARLVGCGNLQPNCSFGATFAPAVCSSLRLTCTHAFFADAARRGRAKDVLVYSLDVNGAFLQVNIDSPVPLFIRLPANIGPLSGVIMRVRKALYGLKQSNHAFHKDLTATMATLGYLPTPHDPSIFIKDAQDDEERTICYFHVDDGNILSLSEKAVKHLIDGLTARYGELTMDITGSTHAGWCLTRSDDAIVVHQAGYINSMADKFADLIASAPGPTPKTAHGPTLFDAPSDTTPVHCIAYQELIGSLMHAKQTRQECSLVLSHLATKNQSPNASDLRHAVHLLRYLCATPDVGSRLEFASVSEHGARLFCYVDASYGCHLNGRSHGGFKFCIGGPLSGPILTMSSPVTDTDVQLSSCEAEYVMLCFASMQAEWLRGALAGIGFPQLGPTTIFEDNQAALDMSLSPSTSRRSRHINIKYHYTRSLIAKGIVTGVKIDSALNHADLISKAKFADGMARATRAFNGYSNHG